MWIITVGAVAAETNAVSGAAAGNQQFEAGDARDGGGQAGFIDRADNKNKPKEYLNNYGDKDTYKKASFDSRAATVRSFGVLLLIVGALLAVNFYLRRSVVSFHQKGDHKISIISRIKVGFRNEVVLLRCGRDEIVIGVGAAGVERLHVRPSEADGKSDDDD